MQNAPQLAQAALQLVQRAQVNVGQELNGAMAVCQFLLGISEGRYEVKVKPPVADAQPPSTKSKKA